ncbi:hypothetical protein SLEP1_g369 [Rubroshorea leprosula]|uniref:Uncharacterized protein n=1 Tax=Rubroshorea leprosula TaxID=152421 RepID=A0AAV5HIL1_9ROSI|nr:hypothetical protein SLEP1_g369 [Rubroshorea leprosula]
MSPSKLSKKLKPARKAWKTFTTKFRSKLQNLHIPESIKSASHRLFELCSFYLFAPFKKRFLARSSSPFHRRNYQHLHQYYHHQNQSNKNFKAVYIDKLYSESISVHAGQGASSSRGKAVADGGGKKVLPGRREEVEAEKGFYNIEDAWRNVVASSPHLRGVDERAEEFIHKVKEEMKLEKEKSLLEFQEMLARSA